MKPHNPRPDYWGNEERFPKRKFILSLDGFDLYEAPEGEGSDDYHYLVVQPDSGAATFFNKRTIEDEYYGWSKSFIETAKATINLLT